MFAGRISGGDPGNFLTGHGKRLLLRASIKTVAKFIGWCAGVCGVAQIPPSYVERLRHGSADFEYRLLVEDESSGRLIPRHPNDSRRSGEKVKIEVRSERGGPLSVWVTSSTEGVRAACPNGCGSLQPNTHFLLPQGEWFQLDWNPARESVLLMIGAPTHSGAAGSAENVAAFKNELVRESGACEGVITGPSNDGEQWAQVRSWCDGGQPVLAEVVIQHPE